MGDVIKNGPIGWVTGALGDMSAKAPGVGGVQIGDYDERQKRLQAQAALYQGQDASVGAGAQNAAINAATAALNGQTATGAQLANAQQANTQNAYSLAASGGGNNAALAQRNAQMSLGNANQAALANAQPALINERNADITALGTLGNQNRTNNAQQGQLGLGYEQLGYNQAADQAKITQGINATNAQIGSQNAASQNQLMGSVIGAGAGAAGMMMAGGGYVPSQDDGEESKHAILANQIVLHNRLSQLEGKKK